MYKFLFSLIILTAFSDEVQSQQFNQKLPYRKPNKSEYSPNFFLTFQKEINLAVPSLGSFAVLIHDTLVYEHYFHGGTDTTLFNIKSITKSIISAIGGIAKDNGKLPDLNTPVLNILTEY